MAVKLRLLYGLPIVDIDVIFDGRKLHIKNVLLDTGSAGTIFDADVVSEIGVMDYGIDIQGIIGFDFLRAAKLVIDTDKMLVYSSM
jgi:hypothetical protein